MEIVDRSDAVREAEIRALHLLDLPMPEVLAHLVRAAAHATGASGARLNVISHERQHSLVDAFDEPSTLPLEESFCARIVREPEVWHPVPDARRDPRFADLPMTRSGDVRSYAAHQLTTANDVVIGTLCVYTAESLDLAVHAQSVLGDLSAAIVEVLEARRQGEALATSVSELVEGSRELRRSNDHLAAFAGQVSHDIQGPLAAVLMSLQLLQIDTGDEPPYDAKLLLGTALAGAERMRDTVSGLMEFAVLGGRLNPARLSMDVLVGEVLMDLGLTTGPERGPGKGLESRSARFEYGGLPAVVGDEVMVRALVQNLVANAVKYAGPEPTIRVSGEVRDGCVRITVADDGAGVPADQRETIFRSHSRGEDAVSRGIDGLGIGLATCRRIVKAHGGSIGVAEAEGGGAAFWFELPHVA